MQAVRTASPWALAAAQRTLPAALALSQPGRGPACRLGRRQAMTVTCTAAQPAAEVTTKWSEDGISKSSRTPSSMGVFVNSNFDSGNGDVRSLACSLDTSKGRVVHELEVKIHPDPYCEKDKREHFQWFYFRVSNCRDEMLNVRITNAGQASYPSAWSGYNVCASYDKKRWFRVPTSYDKEAGVLSWTHAPEKGAVYYAYFAPYSYEQHQALVAEMQCHSLVTLEMLGETLDGHDLDLLRIGSEASADNGQHPKRRVWVIARQHPGESMAEHFVEGLLRRLLDPHDPTSRALLASCVFYVVPCMCPDGVFRGHLRTNAAGSNLNREWAAPSLDASPEVFAVRSKMDEVGVDLMVDVHGDEEIAYNFLVDNRGIPAWDERMKKLQKEFSDAFCRASPDFQDVHGYGYGPAGSANLSICAKQVGERYKCVAMTLEQPFKDNNNLPDPEQGWSPERSQRLGGAMLDAVLAVAPNLR